MTEEQKSLTLAFRAPALMEEQLRGLLEWYAGGSPEDLRPAGPTLSDVARWCLGLGIEAAMALRRADVRRRDVAWSDVAAKLVRPPKGGGR